MTHPDDAYRLAIEHLDRMRRDAADVRIRRELRLRPDRAAIEETAPVGINPPRPFRLGRGSLRSTSP